jgi:hypothetical protein
MYETFVKTTWAEIEAGEHIEKMRTMIYPLLTRLMEDGVINWYGFLIHDKDSGVPTTPDDPNPYLHIRVSLTKDIGLSGLKQLLPAHCVLTRKDLNVRKIAEIDTSLLINNDIAEAWRVFGEQSEWLLSMINAHKADAHIFPGQVDQFLHYFKAMTMRMIREHAQAQCCPHFSFQFFRCSVKFHWF